jgi:hypothetical protein
MKNFYSSKRKHNKELFRSKELSSSTWLRMMLRLFKARSITLKKESLGSKKRLIQWLTSILKMFQQLKEDLHKQVMYGSTTSMMMVQNTHVRRLKLTTNAWQMDIACQNQSVHTWMEKLPCNSGRVVLELNTRPEMLLLDSRKSFKKTWQRFVHLRQKQQYKLLIKPLSKKLINSEEIENCSLKKWLLLMLHSQPLKLNLQALNLRELEQRLKQKLMDYLFLSLSCLNKTLNLRLPLKHMTLPRRMQVIKHSMLPLLNFLLRRPRKWDLKVNSNR